jgi:hypothetical protein
MGHQAARRWSVALTAGCLLIAALLAGCNPSPALPPGQAGRPADVQAEMQRRMGGTTGPRPAGPTSPGMPSGGMIRPGAGPGRTAPSGP